MTVWKSVSLFQFSTFNLLPVFVGVSRLGFHLVAVQLAHGLAFVVLHSLQHSLGVLLFAVLVGLALLSLLLLGLLGLLLLLALLLILLLVLLLLVLLLLLILVLLVLLLVLIVLATALLLSLLLGLLQQTACVGQVVACVVVLRV